MILRGNIHWVDFEPARGSEANKRRPAVVVSNDVANMTASKTGRGVITVVPITSNVERIYPFQVALDARATGLSTDSKAQAEQVRSIDVARVGESVGVVPQTVLARLDDALRLHLDL